MFSFFSFLCLSKETKVQCTKTIQFNSDEEQVSIEKDDVICFNCQYDRSYSNLILVESDNPVSLGYFKDDSNLVIGQSNNVFAFTPPFEYDRINVFLKSETTQNLNLLRLSVDYDNTYKDSGTDIKFKTNFISLPECSIEVACNHKYDSQKIVRKNLKGIYYNQNGFIVDNSEEIESKIKIFSFDAKVGEVSINETKKFTIKGKPGDKNCLNQAFELKNGVIYNKDTNYGNLYPLVTSNEIIFEGEDEHIEGGDESKEGDTDKPGLSGGGIAGIAISVIVIVAITAFCIYWFYFRNLKQDQSESEMKTDIPI